MIKPLLILHLSDLHFGPNSRFCDSDPDDLGQKFFQALETERGRREIDAKISLVIVTGDITERAKLEEYKKAKDFFDTLSHKLDIGHDRFIFVPGNHDVYWADCKRAEIDLEEENANFSAEELHERFNSIKLQNYKKFLEDFYGTLQSQKVIELGHDGFIYNLDDLKLSVAGLNSSELESHRKEDHRGWLSEEQAQSLMDYWHKGDLNSWIKIIAIHHNPAQTIPENVEAGLKYLNNLEKEGKLKSEDMQRFASDAVGFEGAGNLKRVAEDCNVQLILHGHHHASDQGNWSWHGKQIGNTNILSAGSWGLNPDQLPEDQTNSLQLILLNSAKRQLHSWILVYDPRVRTEGSVALGNFTSDPAYPDGVGLQLSLPIGFQLCDAEQQEMRKEKSDNALEVMDNKAKVQAPPRIYYPKPYLLQKHFTGRVKYRQILTKWLTRGNNPIFVLTGLSGSGKSALTWIWFQHDVLGTCIDDLLTDSLDDPKSYCVSDNDSPQGVIWWSFYEREARFSEFLEKSVGKMSEWTNDHRVTSSKREQLDKLIEMLYRHRILIILDGFERELLDYARYSAYPEEIKSDDNRKNDFRACADRYADEFLRRILSPNIRSRILLTSQLFPKQLEGDDHFPVSYCIHEELGDLNSDEAVKFFMAQGVRGSPVQIEAVCSTYGNHTLTLRLLSGLISFHPEHPGDINVASEYDPVVDPETRTYYILSKIYEAMRPEISDLLCKISAFRSAITFKEILILNFFENEARLKDAIKELIDRGLLQFDRDLSLYDLHPIIRKYAYERLEDKVGVHSRLRDHFLDVSLRSAVPDKKKSSEELAPIIELYYHTAKMGLFDEAYKLFDKRLLFSLYYRLGAYLTIIEILTILLPYYHERDIGPKKEKDRMDLFNALALAYSCLGQSRSAEHYHILTVEIGDRLGKKYDRIINRSNLASEQINLGKLAEAGRTLQHKIKGKYDGFSDFVIHETRGRLFAYMGDYTKSSQELNISLKLINKYAVTGQLHQSRCVNCAERAILYLFKKMPEESLKLASQSLDFCLKPKREGESFELDLIRAEWLIGTSLVNLANCKLDKKNEFLNQAMIHLSEALIRCRNINLAKLEPAILLSWAQWYYANDDFRKARIVAEEALNLADRCEYRLHQADIHNFLAQLDLTDNNLENAKRHAQIAYERASCGYGPALDEAKSLLGKISSLVS